MMPSFDAFLKSAIKPIYADAPWVLLEGNIEKIEEQTYMTYKLLNEYLASTVNKCKKKPREISRQNLFIRKAPWLTREQHSIATSPT